MKRREALLGLALCSLAPTLRAQPAARPLRVGILEVGSERAQQHHWRAFFRRLSELGYARGKNLRVEERYAGGATERLEALAAELAALKPDVILTQGSPATQAVLRASKTIPVVFVGVADPVRDGLAASLARPGGNATGLSIITPEIGMKWIELLREISPGATRLAFLADVNNPAGVRTFHQVREQARRIGVAIEMFDGRKRDALERSLEAIARDKYEGLYLGNTAVLLDHREQIVQFAARQTFPTVYPRREYLDAGGLVYYGADLSTVYPRAAEYVQRIAQGAKPAELPIERPATVRLGVNLKAARAQGISIPQRLLVRADEVIE